MSVALYFLFLLKILDYSFRDKGGGEDCGGEEGSSIFVLFDSQKKEFFYFLIIPSKSKFDYLWYTVIGSSNSTILVQFQPFLSSRSATSNTSKLKFLFVQVTWKNQQA